MAINVVVKKQVIPQFHQIFLRGIGCNWLVCIACYLGMQAKDLNSKIVAMWWPIFAFAALGLDHGMSGRFCSLTCWGMLTCSGLSCRQHVYDSHGSLARDAWLDSRHYLMFIFQEPEIRVDGTYYQAELEEGTLPEAAYRQKKREESETEAGTAEGSTAVSQDM